MSDESQDSNGESKEPEPQEPRRSVWEPFGAPDPTDPNAHSEEEAYIERRPDTPAATPDAAEDEGDDEEDAEAKRATLEAEIDRQLATLERVVGDEEADGTDEADENDELEDALEELRTGGGAPVVEPEADEDDADTDDDADVDTTVADDDLTTVGDDDLDTFVDEAWPAVVDEAWPEPATDGEPVEPADEADRELAAIADGAGFAKPPGGRHWMPLAAVAVIAAVVIGVIVASGGDDEGDSADEAPTTAPATAPAGDVAMSAEDALEYFELYGTQDPEQLAKMLPLAAPGSSAHAYAVHQETLGRIDPQRNTALAIARDGDVIEACPEDDEDADCITYADFSATPTGLMTHFTINGSPLRERISVGNGTEVTAGPMRLSIITSYLSVSDRLFVAYLVHNDGTAPISATDVRYIAPDGGRVDPDNDTFREPVAPGTFSIAAAAFPTTERGGTLAIDAISTDQQNQFQAAITVP